MTTFMTRTPTKTEASDLLTRAEEIASSTTTADSTYHHLATLLQSLNRDINSTPGDPEWLDTNHELAHVYRAALTLVQRGSHAYAARKNRPTGIDSGACESER